MLSAALAQTTTAAAENLRTLHNFCNGSNCAVSSRPWSDLAMDASGNLYGFGLGGKYSEGDVFELLRIAGGTRWEYRSLYSFCKNYPCVSFNPYGRPVIDVNGNIYGTTLDGGDNDAGTVFELMPNPERSRWILKRLYRFCVTQGKFGCGDGYGPSSGLTYQGQQTGALYDGTSPLFGTAQAGGRHGGGVAFELVLSGGKWIKHTIYQFCSKANCSDGSEPWGALLIDSKGNLYGTTYQSQGHLSVVFEISPVADGPWNEVVLHTSCSQPNCADGSAANPLIMDAAGNLYGSAALDGASNAGVLFKIVPQGENSPYTVLYNFCSQPKCSDGSSPMSGLSIDPAGNLYGTTNMGGGNDIDQNGDGGGVAFELTANGTYQVLHSFCALPACTDGEYPQAGLLILPKGKLIGDTPYGGRRGGGTIFRLSP
jgi:hypothetical protein